MITLKRRIARLTKPLRRKANRLIYAASSGDSDFVMSDRLKKFVSQNSETNKLDTPHSTELDLIDSSDAQKLQDQAVQHILVLDDIAQDNTIIEKVLAYGRLLGIDLFVVLETLDVSQSQFLTSFEDVIVLEWSHIGFDEKDELLNEFFVSYTNSKWILRHHWNQRFVYPLMEQRSLKDLTDHLADCSKDTLFTPIIDVVNGRDGDEETVYFDKAGYHGLGWRDNAEYRLCGGIRNRVTLGADQLEPVEISSYSLCRWSSTMKLVTSLASFKEEEHNLVHQWYPCVTGVILNNITEELNERQLENALDSELLEAYVSSGSLIEHNLINLGIWK